MIVELGDAPDDFPLAVEGSHQPVDGSEDDELVGLDEAGYVGGKTVIVADLDLFVSDGVVFVDDGENPFLGEQVFEGQAGVAGAGLAVEVAVGEEELAAEDFVAMEGVLVLAHQLDLPDGGAGLKLVGFLGPLGEIHDGHAGGDGPGGDDHDFIAVMDKRGELADQRADVASVDGAVFAGEHTRAQFDDPAMFLHKGAQS